MYNKDADELKKTVHVGTKVTIYKGRYEPFGEGILAAVIRFQKDHEMKQAKTLRTSFYKAVGVEFFE